MESRHFKRRTKYHVLKCPGSPAQTPWFFNSAYIFVSAAWFSNKNKKIKRIKIRTKAADSITSTLTVNLNSPDIVDIDCLLSWIMVVNLRFCEMFKHLLTETKTTWRIKCPWHDNTGNARILNLFLKKMAVLFGRSDIWNVSADKTFDELYRQLGEDFLSASWVTGLLTCLSCPIATVGNGIVLAAILIDPLKKIRSAPSNHTIFNLALADFAFKNN